MDLDRYIASESRHEIRFKATPEVLDALRQKKVFFGRAGEAESYQEIVFPKSARVEEYANFPHRRVFTCGSFSYCETAALPQGIKVGRYCSIAFGLHVFGVRHATEWVTQSSIVYDYLENQGYEAFIVAHKELLSSRFKPRMPSRHEPNAPIIMHDVWIGQNVQIARGVTIGTGSVLAAGSVVTRDVAPYSIVAGVPARLVRMRFEPDLVSRLLASEWWNYHPKMLFELDYTDPTLFVTKFEREIEFGRAMRFSPTIVTWSQILDSFLNRTVVEINNELDNAQFLRLGWSVPEAEFTWALGFSSEIELQSSFVRANKRVDFDFFPTPFREQRVRIVITKCHNKLFSTDFIKVSDAELISVSLESEWTADQEPLIVEIQHPDALPPVAAAWNDDTRELSVALRRLIFHLR